MGMHPAMARLTGVSVATFRRCLLVACLLLVAASCPASAQDMNIWEPLIARLVADGQDRESLTRLFANLDFDPSIMARKVDAMLRKQFEPPPKPTKRTLEQSSYRQFLRSGMLNRAVFFVRSNQAAFDRATQQYGPPPELIASIILVETKLGSYLGKQNALEVLASLARSSDLSLIAPFMKRLGTEPERQRFADTAARDRAKWAYRELLALLRHTAANKLDAAALPGSIYGAIGLCQFMPSNVLVYGVDGDGDGRIDLFTPADAILSVASYLRGHGWHPGLTDQELRRVVYAYNHSDLYVLAVLTVAERIQERLTQTP